MIDVTPGFKTALAGGAAEQRVLIRFEDGTTLTSSDISASTGLQYNETLNPAVDLTVGACPSSTLRFAILDDDGDLSDFRFGKCSASIGVRTSMQLMDDTAGDISIIVNDTLVFGYFDRNTLTIGDEQIDIGFAPKSLIAVDGMIYAFGDGGAWFSYPSTWGAVANYTWDELSEWRWMDIAQVDEQGNPKQLNAWMRKKVEGWVRENKAVVISGDRLREYTGRYAYYYEFVPLGTFIAERPTILRGGTISVDCVDQMVLFDRVLDELQIPAGMTIGDILQRLCDYIGVNLATTVFTNSDVVVDYAVNLQNVTGRELLSAVAEAAGGYARFDRYGNLEIAWFEMVSAIYDEGKYTAFTPVDYEVAAIDKVRLANSASDYGVIVGSGQNAYVIHDNPLLDVVSQSVGESIATNILNRLSSMPTYHPADAVLLDAVMHQTGDIIWVTVDGIPYWMPIFTLQFNWSPSAMVTVGCSGNATRPPESAKNRQTYRTNRKLYELNTGIEGLRSTATEIERRVNSVETQYKSDIAQTAREIRLEVSEVTTTIDDLGKTVSQNSTVISQMAGKIELAVTSDQMVAQLNLSKEGLKIKGELIDITGTISLNGDTKVDASGTLITKNMTATAATITGTFSAPYTRLGQVVWDGEAHQGVFFSSSSTFSASKIVGAFARDSYGEYHLTATGGALYIDTELSEPVMLNGSEVYISAHASDETLVIGRDPGQTAYADLCMYPESSTYANPRGNCGTPAHPWDTCTADQFFSDNAIKSRSSRELKKDIEVLPDMGDVIDRLRPVSFRYRHDAKGRLHYGLIFEDTEGVAPILCERSGDRPEDCRIGYEAINLILLREMQDVRKRLDMLEGVK